MIECQTASPISFHSLFHISLTAVWVDQTILYLIAFIHTESCGNILLLASSFLFPSLEISWSSFKTLIKKNISMYLFSQVKANNYCVAIYQLSSVAQSCQTLWGPWNCPMHLRPPCPSPTPGDCSNSCPSSQWCRQVISSSAVPFSSCLQSFPSIRVSSKKSALCITWQLYSKKFNSFKKKELNCYWKCSIRVGPTWFVVL